MTLDIWIVLIIIIFSLVGFTLEYFRSDLVAILVMSLLIITGTLTAEEATRGFSSPATLTVACMFIISAVFVKAGLVEFTARLLELWEKPNATLSLFALMCIVGFLSAFINNTAAVAVFIPIAVKLAKVSGSTRKRFLMPLSFAAIFGGTCTLLGTSTNILVNSIYMDRGFAGFSMFEFAGLGIILSIAGMFYMMTIGRYLLGSSESEELSSNKHNYLTTVRLLEDSPSVGLKFSHSPFYNDFKQNIVSFARNGSKISNFENETLAEGDQFLLVCSKEKILTLHQRIGIKILAENISEEEAPKDIQIYEIVIPSNSELIGLPLNHSGLVRSQGIIPLAIRHVQQTFFRFLAGKKIAAGDILIVASNPENFKKFQDEENLIVLSLPKKGQIDWKKMIFATALICTLVLSTSLGLISILAAAILVCAILLLTQTISLKEAYESLDAQVLVLLASILSLGLALERSGGAKLIAALFVDLSGSYGPYIVVSALYLLTSLMTEVMSNNATAALMTPIALGIASATGLGEKPFLIAVMMAGSASFMTPVGYQTNTLIFAPGGYKFSDFLKIGTPLNIIFWILATFLIPKFFPFIPV